MTDSRVISGIVALAVVISCCVAFLALAGPGEPLAEAPLTASSTSIGLPGPLDALDGAMIGADARTLKAMSSAYTTTAALHPDDAKAYLALATVELARGHSVAARQALTQWQQLASGR